MELKLFFSLPLENSEENLTFLHFFEKTQNQSGTFPLLGEKFKREV
jgi:hypothetical protein